MPESSPTEVRHESKPEPNLSRREFARRSALAATTALIAPSCAVVAGERSQAGDLAGQASPVRHSSSSPELQAEGELKYQWVIQNYGSRLSDAQKKDVHRLIMEGQKPLAAFRAFPLDNADQPATVLKFTDAEDPANGGPAVIGEDVLFLSVRELGERIRTRQLSPVELTTAYLERDKKYGRQLNAFAMILPDLALEQAQKAETEIKQGHYRGPLHGIPYAAKDLLARQGISHNVGGEAVSACRSSDYDATVIRKLNEAGAVLLGKAVDDRVGRRTGLSLRFRLDDRRRQESLEHRLLDLRLVERFGCDYGGGPGGFRHRHGDLGIDRVSLGFLRRLGLASHLRSSRPRRSHGALIFHGQDRPHVPHCGRLLAGAHRDQRSRSQRRRLAARSAGALHLHSSGATAADRSHREGVGEARSRGHRSLRARRSPCCNRQARTISSVQLPEGPFEAAGGIVINVEAASSFASLIDSGEVSRLNDPLAVRLAATSRRPYRVRTTFARSAFAGCCSKRWTRYSSSATCWLRHLCRFARLRSTPISRPGSRSPIRSAALATCAACRRRASLAASPRLGCPSGSSSWRKC